MKICSAFCVAFILNVSINAAGNPESGGLYVSLDGGVNLLKRIEHPTTPMTLNTDPGVRFDAALGYRFFESTPVAIGAQLETGILYNGVRNGERSGSRVDVDGHLIQIPIIASVAFRFLPL